MFHFSGSRDHNPIFSGYVDSPFRLSGYPIRIPPVLSSLAAPRGFSQLAASFFAYRLQGIPHKPFLCSRSRARFSLPPVFASLKLSFLFFKHFLASFLSLKLFSFPLLCMFPIHSPSPRVCQSARFGSSRVPSFGRDAGFALCSTAGRT